jgi:hypothetical protein
MSHLLFPAFYALQQYCGTTSKRFEGHKPSPSPKTKKYLLAWDVVLFNPMHRRSRLDLVWGFGRAFPPAAMVEFTKYNI